MRFTLTVGLTFLVVSGCAEKSRDLAREKAGPAPETARAGQAIAPDTPHVDNPDPPGNRGAEKPIPQDRAKVERRERERLEWLRGTSVGAYEKVGKRNPRWDEAARKTFDLAARQNSQTDTEISTDEINKSAKAAIDAGCDDPLLVNIFYRTSGVTKDLPPDELIGRRNSSIKNLVASRYPAYRRASTLQGAGTLAIAGESPGEEEKNTAKADFNAALALLPESVATDERNEFWEEKWSDNLNALIAGYRKLGVTPMTAYEKVDTELAKIPELKVLRLRLRGDFLFKLGWEARTTAFAPAVPAGGFETLEECLAEARKAYEESWNLRPDHAWTATALLDIDKAIGGDRATMELWFDRAMKADADRYGACFTKLDWLDPKWHGTAEEMVAFGRACRDTNNWQAGIILLAADAHHRLSTQISKDRKRKYLGSPETWGDIKAVYDEYLKHFPDNNVARSKYAAFAYMAGKMTEADAQFQILGDRLTTWGDFPFYPMFEMTRMRDKAAQSVAFWGKGVSVGESWVKATGRDNSGTWSIGFPDNPRAVQENLPGGASLKTLTSVVNGLTYTLRVGPAPATTRAKSPLDVAREAILADRGGRAVGEPAAASFGHVDAREFMVEGLKEGAVSRNRIAIVGGLLFDLSVTGTRSTVSEVEGADMFFGSLRFQK